jgi:hypothetical protein
MRLASGIRDGAVIAGGENSLSEDSITCILITPIQRGA